MLQPQDCLSLVSFDNHITPWLSAILQTDTGKQTTRSAEMEISSGGSTNLSGGWLSGCELAAAAMESQGNLRNHVVLLSDGHANRGIVDPGELGRHASALRQRGL